MAPAVLHFVQQRPSKIWSYSGHHRGRQTAVRQRTGSALLFMSTPPVRPLVQALSSVAVTVSDQQSGQQVPISSGGIYLKGGLHSRASQLSFMPTSPPGEYTGYLSAAAVLASTSSAAAAGCIAKSASRGWQGFGSEPQ